MREAVIWDRRICADHEDHAVPALQRFDLVGKTLGVVCQLAARFGYGYMSLKQFVILEM